MPLLDCREITKEFTGTRALGSVSFSLEPGQIVGLIGENGAGKSTLIKILAGVHQPDSGTITWQGKPARFSGPHAAISAGITTIHQELAYFERLTVAENLAMGETWPRRAWGGVDWKRLNSSAADQLEGSGLHIDPHSPMHSLSPAQRQEIAIVRALSRRARLIVLDEPTASLTEPEVKRLISHLERLEKSGVAILYVSHRLDEIRALTDRVLVLRDGALVADISTREVTIESMVRQMVGRDLALTKTRRTVQPGPVIFRARDLSAPPLFEGISFEVRGGEVLGLAGLVGAGRSELARAIFGLYDPKSGGMELCGKRFAPQNPSVARKAGVAYLPEERKRQGLVLDHSVASAISLGLLGKISRGGWISGRSETERVQAAVSKYRIKVRNTNQAVGTLSGGNQQKAMLARCMEGDPKLLILDEPSRGVDVGAKAEIHALIGQAAEAGKAVLLISSDLPELLSLSDRVVVLHRGKIAGEFAGETATQEQVIMAASGLVPSSRT